MGRKKGSATGIVGSPGGRLKKITNNFGKPVIEALGKMIPQGIVNQAVMETLGRNGKRVRKLTPVSTIWTLIMLCLRRMDSGLVVFQSLSDHQLFREMWDGMPPTTRAFTAARDRVGVECVKRLFELLVEHHRRMNPRTLRFHGMNVLALDGTCAKTPDSPGCQKLGRPGSSRGKAAFPQMRSVVLAQAGSRLVVEQHSSGYDSGEMTLLKQMKLTAARGALVLMDRGFCCLAAMEAVLKAGGDFLVRAPENRVVHFVEMISLGDGLVDLVLTPKMRRDHPHLAKLAPDGRLRLRMLTYKPEGGKDEITLLTSLADPKIKPGELCSLYHARWEIETIFDEIKTHLCGRKTVNDPVLFRGRNAERAEQEWCMLLVVYNAVRMTMAEAAATNIAGKHGGNPWRLSFTRTLARLKDGSRDMGRASALELPFLYAKMIADIERFYDHPRPNRHYARAVKIKMSKFLCKSNLLGDEADVA